MAYSTGSGTNLLAFMQALRDFAFGQGWTIAKWDTSGLLLFMSKGQCFASFHGIAGQTVVDFNNPPGNTSPDSFIYGCLATSLNASSTTYWNQPGSILTSETSFARFNTNDLQGSFASWHFFSGNGTTDPDYIHCSVQSAADRWTHISIGNVDKGSYTHSGVGYLSALNYTWTRTDAGGPTTPNNGYNDPSSTNPTGGHSLIFGGTYGATGRSAGFYYAPNALPVGGGFAPIGSVQPGNYHMTFRGNNPGVLIAGGSISTGFSDRAVLGIPTPVGQRTPLTALPLFVYNGSTLNQILHLGDYPNVRLCNMSGLVAGQEVAFGADTWKIFPLKRQSSWEAIGTVQACVSGQFGIAYKKVA